MSEQHIELDNMTKRAIFSHAKAEAPRECCGVLIVFKGRLVYVACRNIAPSRKAHEPEQFDMHPEDLAKAEDRGEIIAIVHSHIGIPATPTQPDLVACEKCDFRVPWIIVNPQTEEIFQFKPSGYKAPLYGRVWAHGILDCYTFCQDYYREAFGLYLRDYPRDPLWWHKINPDTGKLYDLYTDNFMKEGFTEVSMDQLRVGDAVLLMAGPGVKVVNHAGVIVEDTIMGHHFMHRLSSRDVYGGWWRKCTVKCLRHTTTMAHQLSA